MLMGKILLAVIGWCGGCFIAGSFLAFLCLIGIIPRLAILSQTAKEIGHYENALAAGSFLGNLLFLYEWKCYGGQLFLLLFGGLGGIFIGCLIGALAEVLQCLPLMSKHLNMRHGITYIIIIIALGKVFGIAVQFLG